MKRNLTYFAIIAAAIITMGAVGDSFRAIMTDSSGNVINTPLTFSNQVTMTVLATTSKHVMTFAGATNILTSATNSLVSGPIAAKFDKAGGTITGATVVNAGTILSNNVIVAVSNLFVGTTANPVMVVATTAPADSTSSLPSPGSRFVMFSNNGSVYFGGANINGGTGTNWVRIAYSAF